MNPELRAVLTEALAAHGVSSLDASPEGYVIECDCGWYYTREDHAKHQAEIIASLPGVAVIQLPDTVMDEDGVQTWPVTQHWQGDRVGDGQVYIRRTDGRISETSVSTPHECAEDARSLAAALLAAAAVAEGEDK